RHARALCEHELAGVDRCFAREHPQERRLAGAVAPGQRHPVAALELERDPAQQRLAGDVLAYVGCDYDRHHVHGGKPEAAWPYHARDDATTLGPRPARSAATGP